ncbi:hypothetical protein [Corynebacterium occultum]|nr:hypothetical protein [Corynebacterium occultum]
MADVYPAAGQSEMTGFGYGPTHPRQEPGASTLGNPNATVFEPPKPRNKVLTVIKYVLALALLIFGVAGIATAFDPAYTATKSDFLGSILTALVFLVPAIWFFTCEIIDKIRLPKTGQRIKRFLWLPALISLASVIGASIPSGDSYGHHLSTTGNFKEILAVHDQAKQECFDSVLSHAKFSASAKIPEFKSGISVATSGELAIHSFAGTAHFPNGFGVFSEYVFLCERAQDARASAGYASDAELSYHSIDVEERNFLTSVPDLSPTGIWEPVETDGILGFEQTEPQPDNIFVFFDESGSET